ncbi:hypothetical protein [Pedobacter sp. R20-19]|uniref:hypothetical protein n=1 Tax=Pedobacter sp. R20-19 TaxID=1270196 RepID=UPI000492F9C0|nr:hypothetical protein [Pedobacter sp. R20-19]
MTKKNRNMYHTQGYSKPPLTEPLLCERDDAWLGNGYYFWDTEDDALWWGSTAKKTYTGFSVYIADIDTENVLDTVFNEEHYNFWLKQIDKAINSIYKKSTKKPGIQDINEYIMSRGGWSQWVTGIMFQDLPSNETISKVTGFYYKKRIQLAAFDLKIINNFAHHYDSK